MKQGKTKTPRTKRASKAKRSRSPRPAQTELALQETRRVSDIVIGERHRQDFGNLAALAASIDARGTLLQPIVITPDNWLIAGERRLRAWPLTKFKNDPIPVHVVTIDSIVAGEWDENAARKDFTPAEAVAIKRALQSQLAGPARERQLAGKKADPKAKGQAGDQAARAAGFDRRTIEKAERIVDAAAAEPERYGPLLEQMNKTGKVNGPFARLRTLQMSATIRSEPPPLPMQGPYRTLVADVPWPSEIDDENPADRGRAFYPYPTMSIKQIAAMGEQIQAICHPDGAWLWFWITNHHLIHGAQLEILAIWGFRPRGKRTWIKPHFGNGKIFRGQTEDVILCSRGNPPPLVLNNLSTKFEGAASGEHSAKPEQFFVDVEAHTPAPRYAYLFAGRILRPLWDGHGDRAGKIAPADADAALRAELEAADRRLLARSCGETKFAAECDRLGIPASAAPARPAPTLDQALELVDAGKPIEDGELVAELREQALIKGGKKLRLTAAGHDRLRAAREGDRRVEIERPFEGAGA